MESCMLVRRRCLGLDHECRALYLGADIILGCDGDLVETGREQQEGLEVAMAHGPSLVGEQALAKSVARFDLNVSVILLQGRIGVAFASHEDASLIDLGDFVGWEVVKLNHGDF